MTAPNNSDGNAAAEQPTVRSAWDAVKGEVTGMAVWGAIALLNVGIVSIWNSFGQTGLAEFWGAIGVYNTCLASSYAISAKKTLKNIPHPTVQSAGDAIKGEVTGMAAWGTATLLNVGVMSVLNSFGHTGLAGFWSAVSVATACLASSCAISAKKTLKNIPAPAP